MKRHQGFTLVELVISMVVIGVALGGVLLVINTSVFFSGDPMISQQALAIAESYLEEILQKDFPTSPCPGGVRSNFRNICNYSGLNESPTDQNGNAISELSNYSVEVTVTESGAVLADLTSDVVRVDVSVSHVGITPLTITGYRTNY